MSVIEVAASKLDVRLTLSVATATGRFRMWTRSGAVWLDEPHVGVRLFDAPTVVPEVAGPVMTTSGSVSAGQPSSVSLEAAPQPRSIGQSIWPSVSLSRSSEHCGQPGPLGQASVSSLSDGETQPGSAG